MSALIFDFEGLPITYDHAGVGAPILFLHNLGGERSIWAAQADALKATNSVYALDWLGYGDSAVPDDGYTVDTYLRLLTSFIDSQGLRDVTLVGNCFGSAMCLLYAQQSPDNVRALVLINPLTAATLSPTRAGWAAWLLRHIPLRPIAVSLQLPGPIAGLVIREQLGQSGGEVPTAALRRRWTEKGRLLPLAEILPDLPRLAVLDTFEPDSSFPPITTIWGQQNRVLSSTAGARLNATLKPRRALTLPACGHLAMMEDPESVTEQVRFAASSIGSLSYQDKEAPLTLDP
ncbi:alpha/beta hydrolase fold protein [Talaromyces proteolyticus]|uniref:Alpha/beta hydrolase fold protein n=1 Tax=Talaromyces proteolyticus TaxID=1131652 RepID=A0AAD4KY45_9EURO|nr:alpha/beta hydrolase fold protein [Talaromyces proteolyticus]KAH8703691.1 alpha/beta hydrolase fold protein [Talaromyces proteolyticus]